MHERFNSSPKIPANKLLLAVLKTFLVSINEVQTLHDDSGKKDITESKLTISNDIMVNLCMSVFMHHLADR